MATSPSAEPPKMIAHWPIAEAICGPRGLFGSRLNGLRPCGRHQTCCLSVMCIRPYAFPCQGSVAPTVSFLQLRSFVVRHEFGSHQEAIISRDRLAEAH